jgi:hypothetical protein
MVGYGTENREFDPRQDDEIALMMEAVRISETSVSFYETTRMNIPEGCRVHIRRHENLKSQKHMPFSWGKSEGNHTKTEIKRAR